ncbi:FAD-dependent monooxygenase [Paracoccus sp. FO-3]|uniref:FAD-dependent monooxygenase n=1 Tax=Paracoccus sp. FO-3 TaxID=1335059 RepID=UPI0015E446A4
MAGADWWHCSIFQRKASDRRISTATVAGNSSKRRPADPASRRGWSTRGSGRWRHASPSASAGSCFLVGDAAHLMPPTGAFGGNSGIHDAHNLAGKLAIVVRGEADAGLLDSYDAERRPVIAATLAQALACLQQWFKGPAGRLPPAVAIVDDYDIVFGQRYDTGAIVPEGPPPDRPFEPVAELSGRPGTRAPHLVVERSGEPISMLDLVDRGFVLLAAEAAWRRARAAVSERQGITLAGGLPLPCRIAGSTCFGACHCLEVVAPMNEGPERIVAGVAAGARGFKLMTDSLRSAD